MAVFLRAYITDSDGDAVTVAPIAQPPWADFVIESNSVQNGVRTMVVGFDDRGTPPPQGVHNFGLRATDGSFIVESFYTYVVGPPPTGLQDFTLSLNPNSLSIGRGETANVLLTANRTGGHNLAIDLRAENVPPNSSVIFGYNPLPGTQQNTTCQILTTANTPTGLYTVSIVGSDGIRSRAAYLQLAVTAGSGGTQPDYQISLSTSTVTIAVGGSASTGITVSRTGGHNGQISFSLSGQPAGVTYSFTPNPLPGNGTSAALSLQVSSTAQAGTYALNVISTDGTRNRFASLTLNIPSGGPGAQDFSISLYPQAITLYRGEGGGSIQVLVQRSGGHNQNITLSTDPISWFNVTDSFSPNPIPPAGNSATYSIVPAQNASRGVYQVTVRATDGTLTRTAQLTVTIDDRPTFSLAVSPSSISKNRGETATASVSVSRSSGHNLPIDLRATNVPAGVAVSFTPDPLGANNNSALATIEIGNSAPLGTHYMYIVGDDGVHTASAQLVLTVSEGPAYDFSLDTSQIYVYRNESTTVPISISRTGNHSAPIIFSASHALNALNVSFNPNPATSNSTDMQVTGLITGSHSLGISALDDMGLARNKSATVHVFDFNVVPSPASLQVLRGSQTYFDVSVVKDGQHTATVNLSAGNLPSGVSVSFSPPSVGPASGYSTATVSANATAQLGTYNITVTGTDTNGRSRTAQVSLTVADTASPDFTISAPTNMYTYIESDPTTFSIAINRANGHSAPISFSAPSVPGVSFSFSPNPASGASTVLSISASSTATPDLIYGLEITATDGTYTRKAIFSLEIRDFNLRASATSLQAYLNQRVGTLLMIDRYGNHDKPVTLSAQNVPVGVYVTFSTNPVPGNATEAQVYFDVSSQAQPGTYSITIRGTA